MRARLFVVCMVLGSSPAMAGGIRHECNNPRLYNKNVVEWVQKALKELKLYEGAANGTYDGRLETVLVKYRRQNGLDIEPPIDSKLLQILATGRGTPIRFDLAASICQPAASSPREISAPSKR